MSPFFERLLFGFGSFDLAACSQSLIAQNSNRFDFRTLTTSCAVFQDFEVTRTRFAVLIDFFGFLRLGAPENQQLANVLDRCCVELFCQLSKDGFALSTVVAQHTDLDQPMGIQGGFGFFDDGRGQSVASNHDDWVKVVGIGAKNFALGRCELYLGHPRIIPARTQKNESQNEK